MDVTSPRLPELQLQKLDQSTGFRRPSRPRGTDFGSLPQREYALAQCSRLSWRRAESDVELAASRRHAAHPSSLALNQA